MCVVVCVVLLLLSSSSLLSLLLLCVVSFCLFVVLYVGLRCAALVLFRSCVGLFVAHCSFRCGLPFVAWCVVSVCYMWVVGLFVRIFGCLFVCLFVLFGCVVLC